jgi:hypothetical protein
LTPFLNQLHDDELVYGYFQQDGATAHTTRATIDFLAEFYDNRIISRNTPNNWSRRSCELTPCDFFLWPHIKNSIYTTPINDLAELRNRITQKINETIDFINVIGDRLIAESGDSKSKKFLFERISLAIQRGNAASIRGTFPDSALLSEIFAL